MKKNNNNNKNIKNKNNKNNKWKKNRKPLQASLVYPYDVNVNFWIKYSSGGTNRNYSIDIKDLLLNDNYFSTLASMYQTFALVYTQIVISPRQVNGTMPPAGYMIYLVDEDADTGLSYADIPNTQGTTYVSNKGTTINTYARSGRQPDTGYWYDTTFTGGAQIVQKIKIRLEEDLRQDIGYYYGRLRFRVVFKRPKRNETSKTTNIKEDEIKITNAKLASQETQSGLEPETGSLVIHPDCENKI